jgi:hypothetical protein
MFTRAYSIQASTNYKSMHESRMDSNNPNHEEMPEGQQVNPVRPQPASVKVKN